MSSYLNLRLQQLEDNIKQDLALVKDYEDALRWEDEPRRKGKYNREIEQLKESANRYKQEYEELQNQVAGKPSTEMQNVANQIQQLDDKVNLLLSGVSSVYTNQIQLRQILLTRFDTNEQKIVAVITQRLNENQLVTMEAVLDALDANQVSEAEMRQLLEGTQQALEHLQQRGLALPGQQEVAEVIKAPELDIKHKLKVTLPIIPTVLEYEAEMELGSGIDLEAAWERLVTRGRRKRKTIRAEEQL